MKPPTKTAAKKAASKTIISPFNKAIKGGDSNGAINILLDKLDESNKMVEGFVATIKEQQRIIDQFRALTSLALATGKL